MRRPRLLCLMHLPPPVHGVTVVNERISASTVIASRLTLDVLPLRFAESVQALGGFTLRKLARAAVTGAELVARLRSSRPDAVYFTLVPSGFAFYRDCVYVAVIKAFGVPRIYHLHSRGVAERAKQRWRRSLYRWVFDDAWVIHLSPLLRPDLDDVVTSDRVRYIPNGVPDLGTTPRDVASTARPLRLLYLSNMIAEKGPLVLVEALRLLHARGVKVEATFAGARSSDGCVEAFRAAVTAYGLSEHVRYVGPAYGAAKQALFEQHDVFVFPSSYDSFPLVVLEAMMHGLPVVSVATGAIPDIVSDGETGCLIRAADPRSLADTLESLVGDRARMRRMGERGRQRYVELFTAERFEQNFASTLLGILDELTAA